MGQIIADMALEATKVEMLTSAVPTSDEAQASDLERLAEAVFRNHGRMGVSFAIMRYRDGGEFGQRLGRNYTMKLNLCD